MDVEKVLEGCRRICRRIEEGQNTVDNLARLAEELAINFRSLDQWLMNGGNTPTSWRTDEASGREPSQITVVTVSQSSGSKTADSCKKVKQLIGDDQVLDYRVAHRQR